MNHKISATDSKKSKIKFYLDYTYTLRLWAMIIDKEAYRNLYLWPIFVIDAAHK
jgi:hypothetical protein